MGVQNNWLLIMEYAEGGDLGSALKDYRDDCDDSSEVLDGDDDSYTNGPYSWYQRCGLTHASVLQATARQFISIAVHVHLLPRVRRQTQLHWHRRSLLTGLTPLCLSSVAGSAAHAALTHRAVWHHAPGH